MTDDLVKRLRGEYRIPINDGLGAVGSGDEPENPYEFVRRFDTAPIQHEAASRIEELEKALLEIAFMEDVVIQSEQHDADLWRFRKIAMRAISKGRQK